MTAVRRTIRGPVRARRWFRAQRFAWVVAAAAVGLWGTSVIGVDLVTLDLSRGPARLALDPLPSSMIQTPEIELRGKTRSFATLTTFVDGARIGFSIPDLESGRFVIRVPVPALGPHRIRVESAYKTPAVADEVAEFSIVRIAEVLPAPAIVGVERLVDPAEFTVVVRATPGTTLMMTGGKIEDDATVLESGRARITVRVADPAIPISLVATARGGIVSTSSGPLDLPALAGSSAGGTELDKATWSVSYRITRNAVTREQTVTVDKRRQEVAELTHGEIDTRSFLFGVAGPAGVAPVGNFGCLLSSVGSAESQLEVGDTAVVTLTDQFPDLLTSWNGLTSDPKLSLCFPWGFPGI